MVRKYISSGKLKRDNWGGGGKDVKSEKVESSFALIAIKIFSHNTYYPWEKPKQTTHKMA